MITFFESPNPSTTSPVVALAVAVIALVGVIANLVVTFVVGRNNTRSAEKMHHESQTHESAIAADDRSSSERLEQYRESHERSIKELEERLRHEFSKERLKEMLNEENWKRIHTEVLAVKKTGLLMIDEFRSLASKGHEYDDETLFEAVSRAVKNHQEFKFTLKELRSDIGQEAYDNLYEIQRYLIVVLLDVARTKADRLAKVDVMSEHLERIRDKEHAFRRWIEGYVKPDFVDDLDEGFVGVAPNATTVELVNKELLA